MPKFIEINRVTHATRQILGEDAAKYAVACADALIKVLKEQPQP